MRKIVGNMIPYWRWVVAIFALLILQVYGDLSLPQYTSDIIDVGIQSRGADHILPEQMTEEDFRGAQLFMTGSEKEAFISLYEREDRIYTRRAEERDLEEYDETFLIPIVMTYQMESMSHRSSDETSDFTLSENMDMGQLTEALYTDSVTDEMVLNIRRGLEEQLEAIGDSALLSMGRAYAAQCDENAGMDMEKLQMDYMWSTGGKMLAMAFLMMICSIMVGYLASRVGAGVGRDLRRKTFGNVMEYSNREMNQFSTASLITRSTNDIQQVQNVTVMLLRMVMMAPIMGIGGVIKVAQTGSGMEWVIGVAVGTLMGFVIILSRIAMPKFRVMQKLVDRVNLVSREMLTGINVIRAFNREELEEERFDQANKELTGTQLFTSRVMTMMMPGMTMIMYGITLLIVWVAAGGIDGGHMQVGQMTAFITYTMMIVMAFLMLTVMSIMLPRAGVAAQRIDEVIRTKTSIMEKESPVVTPPMKPVLRFSRVGFRYPNGNEDVLKDIDFSVEPGTTTAIIGSTGCGKSTLVNLIPRFYDVTSGEITIGGINIQDYSLKALREMIGYVPQKGILFSGTIESNLRLGVPGASPERLEEAATTAQAADFILEKERGYDSPISQGGSNVSGGQKQRLSIARAIAKDPKIYVFDDSFSALDMKTDRKLREALSEKTRDAAVLIVAQRISTILHADQIIVLDEGKIVGKGTHRELLKGCEVYQQIAGSQLSEKELGLKEEM